MTKTANCDMILDKLDQKIISELQINARISVPKLAMILNVARGTVQTRLDKLIASGIIKGFTVRLQDGGRENLIRAFCLIELSDCNIRALINTIKRIPGLASVSNTNGKWDLITEVEVATMADLNRIISHIRALEGVAKSETFIMLGPA